MYLAFRLVPRPLTAAIIAIEMPAAIRPVFDGGGARFVIQETRKEFGHIKPSLRNAFDHQGQELQQS